MLFDATGDELRPLVSLRCQRVQACDRCRSFAPGPSIDVSYPGLPIRSCPLRTRDELDRHTMELPLIQRIYQ